MKLRLLFLITLCAAAPAARAFTYESATELFLDADLDGDGNDDAVVVDRATGDYRIGYQTSPGSYTWVAARPSGITNVTSVTAGKMLSLTKNALAFTGAGANRVNVLAADDHANPALPLPIYPDGFDLSVVVSLNIGIAPVTTYDDFVVAATNGLANPDVVSAFTSFGSSFAYTAENDTLGAWKHGNRVQLNAGGGDLVGVTTANGSGDGFSAVSFASAPGANIAEIDGLPANSLFVFGKFASTSLNQFLFYAPGASNLIAYSVQQPHPTTFTFSSPADFFMGAEIDQVYVLVDPTTPRLLLIENRGALAQVFNFNGVAAPTLLQTFSATGGQSFTGATPLAGGEFHLFQGAAGSGQSSGWQSYGFNGQKYVQTASGSLPSANGQGLMANVFLFSAEPFVSGNPGLLRQLNAADWSSQPTIIGGQVIVKAEHYAGAASGLTGPTTRNLGAAPAGANFALANQYQSAISVSTILPAIGNVAAKLAISPASGPQTIAIQASIAVSDPSFTIYYSVNGGAWTPYSNPFWVFRTSTVRYVAQQGGTAALKTQTQTATYTFSTNPSYADSNGDGVPDFVEIAKGLDPTAGADQDADGFSNYAELLAGTDPTNAADHPPDGSQPDELTSFDLQVAPRPYDGSTLKEADPQLGIVMGLHDLAGAAIQAEWTTNLTVEGFATALDFTNILANQLPPLLAVGAPPNYAIVTGNSDTNIGREVIGLFPAPQLSRPTVSYTLGNASLAVEAANWIAAAKAAQAARQHPVVAGAFGVDETLGALVLERKVNQILFNRSVTGFNATNLTLFHFRVNDTGLQPPTLGQLNALGLALDSNNPGYNLTALSSNILSYLQTNSGASPLRQLAFDIYRISSLSNNASPGVYELPVDAIRGFLITGALDPAYAAVTPLNGATLAAAAGAANTLLNALGGRPVQMFTLTVTSNSFPQGDTQLLNPANNKMQHLFAAPGVLYKFPNQFELLPGSVVAVQAYTDFSDPSQPSNSLEVISATLLSSPASLAVIDPANSLLSEAWELEFFGGSVDPYQMDSNGLTYLQDYLDGIDPISPPLNPPAPVMLKVPIIVILPPASPSKGALLTFTFPAAYASDFNFTVESSPDLGMPFDLLPVTPSNDGHGNLKVELPTSSGPTAFYRLAMSTKP